MAQQPSDKDLEWVQMMRDVKDMPGVETTKEKFIRKFKENPLVPIGCLMTAGALSFGLYSFKKGKTKLSQTMMRARIAAQGFTVFALIGGVLWGFTKK